ncbi:hypothetical protein [Mucilaginibacter sp. AK015]|uniref:hypothetical protein n=1 Tax=Mucilaginibacter sp. AK015 TaxID=2723072 RepID=UPI00160A1A05|nr:hypothetical protein [Mucilaginibacter sp. AK015]MBB5397291.1 hypothetical protein [Mucilaginibacter sp. AK015]
MKKRQLICITLLMAAAVGAHAQEVSKDTVTPQVKSLFYNAGLQYISNLTYAGRRDESSVPLVLPTFTLISKYGLFVSGIGYFNAGGGGSNSPGFSITPGYVFSFDKKKYYGGAVSVTKYFINDDSPNILSSFNTTIDAQLNFNPSDIVKLTLGGSYRFGRNNKNDIVNTAELSKEIAVVKTGAQKTNGLKVTPTFTLYSGTQRFTETYYTNSVVQRAVDNPTPTSPINILFPKQPKQTIINQTVTEEHQREVEGYNLLAVTGSMPIVYAINKWQINFTPYFIKPVKQVNYVNENARNGIYFLFTTGVSVTF